jgi:predicted neuraminidase
MAAWFGGTAEKNPDVGIWISIFRKGKWSVPAEVVNGIQHKDKRYPCWNPVLYNTGREIFLYYKVGPNPREWWGEVISSTDKGKTWKGRHRLPEDIYGPIKNKPVMLNNVTLLCPSSTEHDGWRVHIEITKDQGKTWERTSPLNDKSIGVIQPTLLTYGDGRMQMLCRSTECRILSSWSEDGGYTWNRMTPLSLPNPNSGIDAVTLKDGRQLLVYNHIECRPGQRGGGRNILNVAVSEDGKNWEAAVLLENDQDATEYSYPAVIQAKNGLVHITYTWQRKLIKHVIIDPDKITSKPITEGFWPHD